MAFDPARDAILFGAYGGVEPRRRCRRSCRQKHCRPVGLDQVIRVQSRAADAW